MTDTAATDAAPPDAATLDAVSADAVPVVAGVVSADAPDGAAADVREDAPERHRKSPMYWRLLRLRHVRPSSWQRAVFVEGAIAIAVVLVLADFATAWLIPVLPIAVAVVVKGHDVLVGWLTTAPAGARRTADADQPIVVPTFDAITSAVPVFNEPPHVRDETSEPQPGPEPNVRVVPTPRAVRSRPGAAAARAQASKTGVRRPRTGPAPKGGESAP